jgi:hypothetical protein
VRDVLDAGPGHDASPGERRRRRIAAALVGGGLLVALGAGDELADRRAEATAAAAVDLLLLDDWSGTTSYERSTGELSYTVDLTVRNDGPRTVRLLGIGLPGVQLRAPVELAAGRGRLLSLEGSWACGVREPAPVSVPVEVGTDAGPRSVDLPIPPGMFDTHPLADACDAAVHQSAGT